MDWLKKRLTDLKTYILLFVLSVTIPFVINEFYKYGQTADRVYRTIWNAEGVLSFFGDYLSFFGTIVLGAVAVFQTDKANEKTDAANTIAKDALMQAERSNQLAQEALAQTQKANELAIIGKVIELESTNIKQLKEKNNNYIDACNPEKASIEISDVALYPADYRKIYIKIKMDSCGANIRTSSLELLYALAVYDSDPKIGEITNLLMEHTDASQKLVQEIRSSSVSDDTFKHKKDLEKQFTVAMFEFISQRERTLNNIVYGDFGFDQVKEMYPNHTNTA